MFWLFGYTGKYLDRKAKVNFKIYDVQTAKKTITIYILSDMSGSKDR